MAKTKQNPKLTKVKDTSRDGEVKTSNKLFVALKEYGMLDARGRKVFSIGLRGRFEAQPDRPLQLVLGLLGEIAVAFRYSSEEAEKADLDHFKWTVAQLGE